MRETIKFIAIVALVVSSVCNSVDIHQQGIVISELVDAHVDNVKAQGHLNGTVLLKMQQLYHFDSVLRDSIVVPLLRVNPEVTYKVRYR